ncbi:hypothetical protein ACET9S_15315 [Aeromonas caviae]|uniref:hypothetical protein n=1 Tax=Aeromonas caviae TaxID=648 RepID=UPI0038D2381B
MTKKLMYVLVIYALFLVASIELPVRYSPIAAAQAAEWYEGGTLHQANALQWQKASDADKLATCSDLVAAMYTSKSLKPELQRTIKSVDDLKPLAEELVNALDKAFPKNSNEKNNEKLYKNQIVADTAAMLMLLMGWLK